MPDGEFVIVDVFAEQKYSGNQLAVFKACSALREGEINTDNMPRIEFHNARTVIIGPDKVHRKSRLNIENLK